MIDVRRFTTQSADPNDVDGFVAIRDYQRLERDLAALQRELDNMTSAYNLRSDEVTGLMAMNQELRTDLNDARMLLDDSREELTAEMKLVDALRADLAAAQRDAERYRWMRAQQWDTSNLFVVAGGKDRVKLGTDCPSSERLDALVDAAIASEEKGLDKYGFPIGSETPHD